MPYNFELGHNAAEATKNICCAKGRSAVGHSTVTKWLKKFYSSCKNIDDQASSVRFTSVNSAAVIQARETNQVSRTQRVSGELVIS